MKHRITFLPFVIFVFLLMQISAFAEEQGKHALLIGIQNYGGGVLFKHLLPNF
jgi:hypothetical protein